MKKRHSLVFVFTALVACLCGCAIIAGQEDSGEQGVSPALKLNFVETLSNQESLRGRSLQEIPNAIVTSVTSTSNQLLRPGSVYADQFRVYVADTYVTSTGTARIVMFDRGNRTATAVAGSAGSVKLLAPAGIAVDSVGVIFVSDSQQGRVFGYDRQGNLLIVIGKTGELSRPSGIAIDNARNRLYVADSHAHQVKVFTNIGTHLFDIGSSGKPAEDFKFPAAVALDRAGNVYVLDSLRLRVNVFNPEGAFLKAFSLKSTQPGASIRPKGLAVDSDGHVYVADAVNNNVLVFNNDGTFVLAWGRTGRLFGDFWTPSGIFIDDHDLIYVADQTNGRVQVFQLVR